MSQTAAVDTPTRLRDAVVLTCAPGIAEAPHEVLSPRMHTRGADELYRSRARAAPP